MVDRFEQEERYGPDLTIIKRTRFNQTIEPYRTNEVPEHIGAKPHTVKQLPALPVRERQQDDMLQHPNNMLQDGEIVNFGQRVASDLRFRAAISEPKTPSFCEISGGLAPSTRKPLAIAIVRFWYAKPLGVLKVCAKISNLSGATFSIEAPQTLLRTERIF